MENTAIITGNILLSVSEALRGLIRDNIPELRDDTAVVFDSPADIDKTDENKLSLFLYHAESNPFLRNLPPTLTLQTNSAGPPAMIPAPLVMDLFYMMVPYAKSAELELVLADRLVRLFHDTPELSGNRLNPLLKATDNTCISILPMQGSIDTLRHIWAGFPNRPYKLTQLYTLSPVRIPSGYISPVDMVTDAELTTL